MEHSEVEKLERVGVRETGTAPEHSPEGQRDREGEAAWGDADVKRGLKFIPSVWESGKWWWRLGGGLNILHVQMCASTVYG